MKTKIILGDSQEELPKLINEGIRVDLTVTSPPYDHLRNYNNSLSWDFQIFKKIADSLYSITKDGGVVVWVVNDATVNGSETGTSFKQALYFKDIGFNLHDTMIYRKENPIPLNHNRYEQCFEYMFVLSKGKPKTFNPLLEKCKTAGVTHRTGFYKSDDDDLTYGDFRTVKSEKIKANIFSYSVGGGTTGKFDHPAMFPVDLARDQILSWSNPNDIVLDCFCGSGTVGVCCLENERNFIGIEKERKYYDISKQRCREYQTRLV